MTNRFTFKNGIITDTTSNQELSVEDAVNKLNELNTFLSPFSEDWNSEEDKHWDSIEQPTPAACPEKPRLWDTLSMWEKFKWGMGIFPRK